MEEKSTTETSQPHASADSQGSTSRMDRSQFRTIDSFRHIWRGLNLPEDAISSLTLEGADGPGLPSSFKIGHLAQVAISLTALLAALIYSERSSCTIPSVTVALQHALVEFKSERLYLINGKSSPPEWGPIGGLHKTMDGYVRVHDGFPNHRIAVTKVVGCKEDADRATLGSKISTWKALELENAAVEAEAVVAALRTYDQWDALPQAKAIRDFPIHIRKIADGPPGLPSSITSGRGDKCLRGLRVLEMSRVIATPVAGKTLAAHGADVLWITSPRLPDQPPLDRDLSRGKRTARLDISVAEDSERLSSLLDGADVFLQGFRPGSLASKGFSSEELAARHPKGIICANMSAYGPDGPWSKRRGFDSLVQTCSGMNVSEAEHFGAGEPARPTPCQALDHAAGYFLAAGIMTALYRQAVEGGSYQVDVSLAGVMVYLRSLGQFEGKLGFQQRDFKSIDDVPEEYYEERESGFGLMKNIKHSSRIDGVAVGWDIMPKPLGSDEAAWL